MVSSQEVDEIITVVKDLLINKHFITGVNALWFYDYFLTLADEVEYAWSGKKSFVFWLFILNRYWPAWFMIWVFVSYWSPDFIKAMCDDTAWFSSMIYFTFATLFAQTVITLRVYAVTGNNRLMGAGLSFITLVQFTLGMYMSVLFALQGPAQVPAAPLEEYQICLFQRWRTGELVYTVLSVLYDCSAFLLIVYAARKRGLARASGRPSLLSNIVQGTTIYFLVVFVGQLLLIFFELVAPGLIQLLLGNWNSIFVPLMISRLMLSLRKTASSPELMWSSNFTSSRTESVRFAQRTVGEAEWGGDIAPPRMESIKLAHHTIGGT